MKKIGEAIGKAISDTVKNILSGAITTIFDWISAMLGGILNTDGISGYSDYSPEGMITVHPYNWENGDVWTTIKGVSDNAIVPVAGMILLVVLVTELIQLMTAGNQFENAGAGFFVKWPVKAIVGIVVVSRVFDIASWVFGLGIIAGEKALAAIGNAQYTLTIAVKGETGELLIMLGCTAALIMTVMRSGSISKSIFGAN